MGTFKKLQQEFQEAFKDLDLGHGMTWTSEGTAIDDTLWFAWESDNEPCLTYYIIVYLNEDGTMKIDYAYPGGEVLHQEFEVGEYDKVKEFVLNYFDNTEREEK